MNPNVVIGNRYSQEYGEAPPGRPVKITRDQMLELKKTLREQVDGDVIVFKMLQLFALGENF